MKLRAAIFALTLLLRLLVIVELAFDAIDRAMEQVDGRPEKILEVRDLCGGDLTAMAAHLEVSKSGLQQRMRRLGIG